MEFSGRRCPRWGEYEDYEAWREEYTRWCEVMGASAQSKAAEERAAIDEATKRNPGGLVAMCEEMLLMESEDTPSMGEIVEIMDRVHSGSKNVNHASHAVGGAVREAEEEIEENGNCRRRRERSDGGNDEMREASSRPESERITSEHPGGREWEERVKERSDIEDGIATMG